MSDEIDIEQQRKIVNDPLQKRINGISEVKEAVNPSKEIIKPNVKDKPIFKDGKLVIEKYEDVSSKKPIDDYINDILYMFSIEMSIESIQKWLKEKNITASYDEVVKIINQNKTKVNELGANPNISTKKSENPIIHKSVEEIKEEQEIEKKSTEKHCNKCDTTKSLTEFNKNSRSKDGYSFYCKECMSSYGSTDAKTKKCSECKKTKPSSEFHKNQYVCKTCRSKKGKKNYKLSLKEINDKKNEKLAEIFYPEFREILIERNNEPIYLKEIEKIHDKHEYKIYSAILRKLVISKRVLVEKDGAYNRYWLPDLPVTERSKKVKTENSEMPTALKKGYEILSFIKRTLNERSNNLISPSELADKYNRKHSKEICDTYMRDILRALLKENELESEYIGKFIHYRLPTTKKDNDLVNPTEIAQEQLKKAKKYINFKELLEPVKLDLIKLFAAGNSDDILTFLMQWNIHVPETTLQEFKDEHKSEIEALEQMYKTGITGPERDINQIFTELMQQHKQKKELHESIILKENRIKNVIFDIFRKFVPEENIKHIGFDFKSSGLTIIINSKKISKLPFECIKELTEHIKLKCELNSPPDIKLWFIIFEKEAEQ